MSQSTTTSSLLLSSLSDQHAKPTPFCQESEKNYEYSLTDVPSLIYPGVPAWLVDYLQVKISRRYNRILHIILNMLVSYPNRFLECAFSIGSKLRLNFIRAHYVYIVFCTFLASCMIYPWSGLDYIDCLLFAAGSATQSGISPLDLSCLRVFQQGILWLIVLVTNPIFIHSLLVLARLYHFQKRFRSVSDEEKAKRQLYTRRAPALQKRPKSYGTMTSAVMDRFESSREGSISCKRAEMVQLSETSSRMREIQKMVYGPGGNSLDDDQISTSSSDLARFIAPALNFSLPLQRCGFEEVKPEPPYTDNEGKREGQEQQPLLAGLADSRRRNEAGPLNRTTLAFDLPSEPFTKSGEHEHGNSLLASDSVEASGDCLLQEPCFYSDLPPLMLHSTFVSYSDWDETKKDRIGGIEYRALKTLLFILAGFLVTFHVIGFLALITWLHRNPEYESIIHDAGANRYWWAIFTAGSAFHNVGYTLTPDSMVSFEGATLPLLTMSFLVVVGNTGFPCMLRFTIWLLSKMSHWRSPLWEELQFLLDHPRRCFTMLFPRDETWRLAFVLLALNVVDLIVTLVLGNNQLPGFIAGVFQVISTRTAGFTVTPVSQLQPAIQISFVVMMYISAFPTTMTMRKTNIYEEKSLGIYDDDDDDEEEEEEEGHNKNKNDNDLQTLLEEQLCFDVWYIVLGLFLVTLAEGRRIQTGHGNASKSGESLPHEEQFTLFAVLFEIVAAYGTVGLSVGDGGSGRSFSGGMRMWSKVVILAMQVRGRHRGLPCRLDHAVLLSNEREVEE